MKKFICAIIMAGVCFLLYMKIFSFDLTYFDDHFLIEKFEQNSASFNIGHAFKSMIYTSYYRPVLSLSFLADAYRGGQGLNAYHATNLILHSMASVLLFLVFLKLEYPTSLSFIFGLFVAIHPIMTPAVAWIPGRNDPILSIFILLSFVFLIFFMDAKSFRFRRFFLGFHILFFEVSLLSKENAVVFPVVCAAYIVLYRKERFFTPANKILMIGWLLVCVLYASLRIPAMASVDNPDSIGFAAFFKNYLSVFALIGKIFLPIKMSGYSEMESFSIISGIFFVVFFVGIVFFSKQMDRKKASFGLLWFFLFLIPTLFVRIDKAEFDYLEHRAYTPILGLSILILESLKAHNIDLKKNIAVLFSVVILCALALRTYYYEEQFKNQKSFWTHTNQMFPQNSAAYFNLGVVYYEEGDLNKSENHFLQSIYHNPEFAPAYINLSTVYKEKNNLEKSELYAEKATAMDQNNPKVYHHLGKVYILKKEWEKALKTLEKGAELSKDENKNLNSHLKLVRDRLK